MLVSSLCAQTFRHYVPWTCQLGAPLSKGCVSGKASTPPLECLKLVARSSCQVVPSTHLSPPAFTHSHLLPWLASTDLETLVATKTMVWVAEAEAGRGPVVAMAGFGGVCFLTAHSPDGCLFGIHRGKHVL